MKMVFIHDKPDLSSTNVFDIYVKGTKMVENPNKNRFQNLTPMWKSN